MANIRVDVPYTIKDGSEVVFNSPCDFSEVEGMKVCYLDPQSLETTTVSFKFCDACGNDLTDLDTLFASGVLVKAILDVTNGKAFIQNEVTNAYIEGRFNNIPAQKGDTETSVVLTQNARALSNYSIASGVDSIAGIKGYYYNSIDFSGTNPIISCSDIQGQNPSKTFTVQYSVGDVITIVNDSKYYDCATIKGISGNKITVDSLPFTTVTKPQSMDIDDLTLYVLEKPSVGLISLEPYAFSEGQNSRALGRTSHAEGRDTLAYGQYGHTEGRQTKAGYSAHAEGRETVAKGEHSHSEGHKTLASGRNSHAQGKSTTASGESSHAEGTQSTASGNIAHAEGYLTVASGQSAHSEGDQTKATAIGTHSEGYKSLASGQYAHAEGFVTESTGLYAHSEGEKTKAQGKGSHAEGGSTIAVQHYSHAEGFNTQAKGYYSHTEGTGTVATANAQHIQGQYNIEDVFKKYAHIVGNGTSEARNNAHTLDWDGNAWFAGNVYTDAVYNVDGSVKSAKKLLTEDKITFGTQDLEAGVSALETGKLYFVYE